MLSAAHTRNGKTTYENLMIVDGEKGKWTPIETVFVAGNDDVLTLYVETFGSPNLEYEIRNFRVISGTTEADRFAEMYNDQYSEKLSDTVAEMNCGRRLQQTGNAASALCG